MKIIVTSQSPGLDSDVDPRFGRGAYYLIVDTDSMDWDVHPNSGVGASGGAGTLAAQFAAKQQVAAVISGDFGPNAYAALDAAGISMYLFGGCQTVRQAVDHFKAGKLHPVGAPTAAGHHPRA